MAALPLQVTSPTRGTTRSSPAGNWRGGAVALDLRRRLDGARAGALFGRVGLEGSGRYATTGNLMDEGVAFVRLDWRFVPTLEAGGVF